ncbi:MRG-domain-containing protein [Rhizodiscina lignyota]|uniref:Chromatin modification-related protein EAF3 n=1 Tax=Rhizodiscina lignyota TaxID=1504668 RepID=A0A9P4M8E2_9PEZI|nr:MRG-domain-containing protein [Rhizodiscina lignyota]
MAPASPFAKDEKVLCFHGDLLYEAKILDTKPIDPNDKRSPHHYLVHYKGWKNTWDDWVPQDRLRKFTDENQALARTLISEMRAMHRARYYASKSSKKGKHDGSTRASEERHSSVAASGQMRGYKRNIAQMELEDDQVAPIPMADQLKSILVDDWENITKYLQVISLPVKVNVRTVMDQYLQAERQNRTEGSAEADILEEVVHGVITYFDKCLSRMLLYKFEREQFRDIHKQINDPVGDLAGKQPSDLYGAEHLLRSFTTLPELIAHTALDEQGVARLREELTRITQWLGRPDVADKVFVNEYENVSSEYENNAKK